MRVLLDENLDPRFGELLEGCEVETVKSMGWRGLQNGELLRQARMEFDGFLTLDRGIVHQQNLSQNSLKIVVIRASDNRLETLAPAVHRVRSALDQLDAGSWCEVEAS